MQTSPDALHVCRTGGERRRALVTGIRGQDGVYLASLLLAQGCELLGTSHDPAAAGFSEIDGRPVRVVLLDLCDNDAIRALVTDFQPDEVYNLAARASSAELFDDPVATGEINGLAPVRFLEAIRRFAPHARFCQAGSSEVFAATDASPQREDTPMRPANPYGAAKAYASHLVREYRERHGLFAVTAILYNHESPRRGPDYVTRRISSGVARIARGLAREIVLGPLESRRDWGFAGDHCRAMWQMLQQPGPDDFIVATGRTHSVRDFCEIAFAHVGLDYREHVRVDPARVGRIDAVELRGDPSRAASRLGWRPSIGFADLVRMMVDSDIARLDGDAGADAIRRFADFTSAPGPFPASSKQ